MIVKIINGNTKSVKDAVEHIADIGKGPKQFEEAKGQHEMFPDIHEDMTFEEYYLSCKGNNNQMLSNVGNEHKVRGYISGYLCNPVTADKEFRETKKTNLSRIGKTLREDNENYYYHIIQSFPEDLDISDDEVHQCGVELVERLGLYQAVIASHFHPTIDERGSMVACKCKHNHIIMNSHIYYEFVDLNHPRKMKYHNCTKTYKELQRINDQIAIEHGLPVITNKDNDRTRTCL